MNHIHALNILSESGINRDELLDYMVNVAISQDKERGNKYYQQQQYRESISIYSRILLKLNAKYLYPLFPKYVPSETLKWIIPMILDICYGILLNNLAQCYIKLKMYHKALRDLNFIIDLLPKKQGIHNTVIPYFQKALYRRGKLYVMLGNTARAISDFGKNCVDKDIVSREMVAKLCLLRHPSPNTLALKNKYTKKFIKFFKKWKLIKPKTQSTSLPSKQGHSMIAHKGKLYCFGGSNVSYGRKGMFWAVNDKQNVTNNMFLEISFDGNYYECKRLQFPEQHLFEINAGFHCWSRWVTTFKWNNKMIVFGGNNPFQKLFFFEFDTTEWQVLHTETINFEPLGFIQNHCGVIINDKLYIYGGTAKESMFGLDTLFCLDLIDANWRKVVVNHGEIVPEQRYHATMWCDDKKGKSGTLYIAFGQYLIKNTIEDLPRYNIYSFDIYKNKWCLEEMYGNMPFSRAECGYTHSENNNGVILFGGYNSRLPTMTKPTIKINYKYTYFGDCFEYSRITQKWKLIQAIIAPPHRALPALTRINNKIVLYGGYHGSGKYGASKLYNDLWILDMNKCKDKEIRPKICKVCKKISHVIRLYLCSGCQNTRYCSKKCQKKHWNKHKLHCFV